MKKEKIRKEMNAEESTTVFAFTDFSYEKSLKYSDREGFIIFLYRNSENNVMEVVSRMY